MTSAVYNKSMSESLITSNEAEEVVDAKTGPFSVLRTPMLIFLGLAIIITATIIVVIIMSLRGAQTGLEAALPFLDKKPVESLQAPER